MWTFSVEFGQTILWETGACSYLWGTIIIMGVLAFLKYAIKIEEVRIEEKRKAYLKEKLMWLCLFLCGIVAGWCNENTSGGTILLVLIGIVLYWWKYKKVSYPMTSVFAGGVTGFLLMVTAPGNYVRIETSDETHTGIMAIFARFLKCTESIEKHFMTLFTITAVIFIILCVYEKSSEARRDMIIYSIVFFAVCYCLILIPIPMDRVYFGAGIFLMVACAKGFAQLHIEDNILKSMKYGLLLVLSVNLCFSYIQGSAQLLRIYMANQEREAYIEEEKAKGNLDLKLEPFPEVYKTKYSYIHHGDVTTDPDHWMNWGVEEYYGLHSVVLDDSEKSQEEGSTE